MIERPRRNVTSVGGLVVRDRSVLLVRMAYGPSKGRYMLPGGLVDPGETLDVAIRREVLEETGVTARPLGIIGLRSRYDGPDTDNYILWLLAHETGEPRADELEIEEAAFLTLAEIEGRQDVTYIAEYMARRVLSGTVAPHGLVDDYAYQTPGTDADSWKLFM